MRWIHVLLVAVLLLPSVLGCTTSSPSAAPVVRAEVSREAAPAVADEDVDVVADGVNAFGLDLYRALAEEEGGNLFLSPYSIALALAMTYAGARGQTAQEMAEVLHLTMPDARVHPAMNALDLALHAGEDREMDSYDPPIFRSANALWGQQGLGFEQAFLETLAANYGAGMRVLDFAESEEAREIINAWVEEQTEDRIQDLIKPDMLNALTRLVLTNAVYFKAQWQYTFSESATADGPFYLPGGDTVTTPMMRQTESLGYYAEDGLQVVELPYAGGSHSMLILLPEQGELDALAASLDEARLRDLVAQVERQSVALTMPRFEYEAEFALGEMLQEMGMPTAFGEGADFSGMTTEAELFISEVVHKAWVAVDEEGTEAAAATAVVMVESALPMEPVEVTVDHPFLFAIRHQGTGSLLFLGQVVDPS
jgi:serpin B